MSKTKPSPKELDRERRPFEPVGHARELIACKDKEVLACGGVGSGKSRAILEKIHAVMNKYPGMRAAMIRKTRASLTQSGIKTFENHVLPPGYSKLHSEKQSYTYPNGSELVVGGMEDSERIMSSEYDLIYVQEATELKERDWEDLLTRLRNYVVPYQQIIGDCNPKHPNHWLKKRCDTDITNLIQFDLKDNPVYWNYKKKEWTEKGADYFKTISRTTGARYKRNVLGLWASEEGMVYDIYEPEVHISPRFRPPDDWPRIWTFDFGFRNPFVWQEWVINPDDPRHSRGVLYLYRQIYRKGVLIQRAAEYIKSIIEVEPTVLICDHDAQGRAVLEDELELNTWPAYKSVLDNINRATERLYFEREIDTQKVTLEPTIYIMENSLVHRPDPQLKKLNHPTCTEEEFYVYVWDEPKTNTNMIYDKPKKEFDHGMDCMAYTVAQVDVVGVSDGVY